MMNWLQFDTCTSVLYVLSTCGHRTNQLLNVSSSFDRFSRVDRWRQLQGVLSKSASKPQCPATSFSCFFETGTENILQFSNCDRTWLEKFPPSYIRVILYSMYTDQVDTSSCASRS